MEWIPRGLPNIHAPVPICGEFEEKNIKLQLWARGLVGFFSFSELLCRTETNADSVCKWEDGRCAVSQSEKDQKPIYKSFQSKLPKNIHFNKYLYLFYLIKYLKFNKPEKQIFIKCNSLWMVVGCTFVHG